MTDSESPTVSDVFDWLNRRRHLPFYSLETRAAPFFAIFLRDVLSEALRVKIHDTLIPEFPLRIGTLKNDDHGKELSYNVDYVGFSEDKTNVYLVELKTDLGSKRDSQDDYLCKAQRTEFDCLVKGVRQLAEASRSKRKYVHLLHQLSEVGFVSKNHKLDELYKKSFPEVVSGWTKAIERLTIGDKSRSKPEVVFIQPAQHKSDKSYFKYIYFKKVAKIVETKGDLGKQFAECLREWQNPPGYRHPREFSRRS